jgi:hypothetical protein
VRRLWLDDRGIEFRSTDINRDCFEGMQTRFVFIILPLSRFTDTVVYSGQKNIF